MHPTAYIIHTSNEKISKNRQSFLARKAMHIYKSTVLFLPILGYFCLFLPICESVANLHESTLLFALNIHAYFCLFSSFDLCYPTSIKLFNTRFKSFWWSSLMFG